MTDASNNAHRVTRATPLPRSPEEILAGDTQAGVPRPSFLKDHEDDGTVQKVGKSSLTVNQVRALEGLPPLHGGTRDGAD